MYKEHLIFVLSFKEREVFTCKIWNYLHNGCNLDSSSNHKDVLMVQFPFYLAVVTICWKMELQNWQTLFTDSYEWDNKFSSERNIVANSINSKQLHFFYSSKAKKQKLPRLNAIDTKNTITSFGRTSFQLLNIFSTSSPSLVMHFQWRVCCIPCLLKNTLCQQRQPTFSRQQW